MRPGYIESFDARTQLVQVTPAIMMKKSVDGKVEYKKLPIIINVPISLMYAQTLGLVVTLPIRKGDECTLIFSDRFLDDFIEKGAQQGNAKPECCGSDNKTSEPRMHHMTDGICFPGIITKPFRVPKYNTEAIEIRNKDRTCFFSMNQNCNITIQTTGNISTYCNNATVSAMSSVNISGNGGVYINESSASTVTSNGNCCCAGSCSSNYRDSCCGVTQQGNMCCNGACSPGATSNCMRIDDVTGNLKLRIPNVNG